MEFSWFPQEKVNRCKKKVIPWHVQKRYMENLSQLSLNQTLATAFYKKQIKSLQKNNKHLALALQKSRHLAIEKENLLIDNGKILEIINFSKLQLMDMAIYMKQATACLDETIMMLNSSITENLSKQSPMNLNYQNYFKDKLQEINIESIEEVELESNISNEIAEPNNQKGKISRVNGCAASPNKKCRYRMKGRKYKSNCKNTQKFVEELVGDHNLTFKNSTKNNFKKCSSMLSIEYQSKKKAPKHTSVKSAPAFKLTDENFNISVKAKIKKDSFDKKCKAVKNILTDAAEAFITLETECYNSAQTTRCISSTNKAGFAQKSSEVGLIEKDIACEFIQKQKTSPSTLNAVSNHQRADCSQNTSDPSYLKNISSLLGDTAIINNKLAISPSKKFINFTGASVQNQQTKESGNSVKKNNEKCIKTNRLKKGKIQCNSSNSKVKNRVQFYFDENSIEKVDGKTTKYKKSKCKKYQGEKTVPNMLKNIPSKCTALNSNLKLPDNVSKIGKNSFLVTAEIHTPPVGVHEHKTKSKTCVSEKREPCVVLTDIFESNKSLLSEMVNGVEPRIRNSRNATINSAENPLVAVNVSDLKSIKSDFENDRENRCLPEDKEILKKRDHRHRDKVISYKEPSLNVKMRRLI